MGITLLVIPVTVGSFRLQKSILGIPDLEKRIIILEAEQAAEQKIYSEAEENK
jgi:hypothetical protein